MKINERTRFPHPVLSASSDDYLNGSFEVDVTVTENRTSGEVEAAYTTSLIEPRLEQLVDAGEAAAGIFVVCRRTYYNELHFLEPSGGVLSFGSGQLKDEVLFRPLICAVAEIEEIEADNFHKEFGAEVWEFATGDVLALGDATIIDVGLDKLAPMESIFSLAADDQIPEGETRVDLESDKITVVTHPATKERVHALRFHSLGQLALLNGVYLPAVMEVLNCLHADAAAYESRRWFRVFSARCNFLGIDLQNPNMLEDAQKLLKSPLDKLSRSRGLGAL